MKENDLYKQNDICKQVSEKIFDTYNKMRTDKP
jgi:hypothetical protein